MKYKDAINLKLQELKNFQDKFPNSHVGGSIGLMLHGINLERSLYGSDLDITIDEFDMKKSDLCDYSERSTTDFDYSLKKDLDDKFFIKIDIRVSTEPGFDIIEHNGIKYNVSKLKDILYWKKKFAEKGVEKHIKDLQIIERNEIKSDIVKNLKTELKKLSSQEQEELWIEILKLQ